MRFISCIAGLLLLAAPAAAQQPSTVSAAPPSGDAVEAHASARNQGVAPDLGGMGGPYEPVPDYPPCGPSRQDSCQQDKRATEN